MRILQVNKFLYRRGGAEAYMEDVSELLTAAGHEVHFFGMAHPENTHLEHAEHLPSEVELDPLPPGAVVRARTALRIMWSREAQASMDAVLDKVRPDLVHLHNIYHQLSPSILRPVRRRGIPAVMTLHDYKLACPTYQFLDKGTVCMACVTGGFRQAARRRCKDGSFTQSALLATETAVHRRLDAYGAVRVFLCPSTFLLGKMQESGVYPARLHHLPNFASDPAGGPGDRTPDGPVVLAARLAHEKGVEVLVRAAALLRPGTSVVIVGDGPQRGELEALAAEVAPGRVRFLGHQPKSLVSDLMRSASVVVCPSTWHENQPMTIIEAFAAGRPVVGSDLGGISELVRDGVEGRLVAPGDPGALASAVDSLVGSSEWSRASAAARKRFVEEFSPDVHLGRLLAAYRLSGARSPRVMGTAR